MITPEKVYLDSVEDFNFTWCIESFGDYDTEYVRHDRCFSFDESRSRDIIIMINARRLIKSCKITSNGILYMNLFGTGYSTARSRCKKLGFYPDSNITCRHLVLDSVQG